MVVMNSVAAVVVVPALVGLTGGWVLAQKSQHSLQAAVGCWRRLGLITCGLMGWGLVLDQAV